MGKYGIEVIFTGIEVGKYGIEVIFTSIELGKHSIELIFTGIEVGNTYFECGKYGIEVIFTCIGLGKPCLERGILWLSDNRSPCLGYPIELFIVYALDTHCHVLYAK